MLVRDAPVDVALDDLAWSAEFDIEEVRRLFDFLEFRTLFDRLAEAVGRDLGPNSPGAAVLEAEPSVPESAAAAVDALTAVTAAERGGRALGCRLVVGPPGSLLDRRARAR